jgi:hypothetical protein
MCYKQTVYNSLWIFPFYSYKHVCESSFLKSLTAEWKYEYVNDDMVKAHHSMRDAYIDFEIFRCLCFLHSFLFHSDGCACPRSIIFVHIYQCQRKLHYMIMLRNMLFSFGYWFCMQHVKEDTHSLEKKLELLEVSKRFEI